ncbi:hypothetical protein AOB46_16945 [Chryseobacterium indologenes]|uniref:Uncharacterized protein n=2 Tax=Chryseobacterium indologenes TaxID=253 RepID=A0A0N0ZU31_CHRID|nr:hypothetical protein AOB46_16945 [Chryseobacterium indologenes]
MVRYAIRELIDLMYSEGNPVEMNREFLSDDYNINLSDEEFEKLQEFVNIDENGRWWIDSIKRRLTKAQTARENGKNGGRPRKNTEKKEVENKTQKPSEKTNDENPKNPPYKNKINKSKVNNNIPVKFSFVSIKDLNESVKSFEGNKSYFLLAYRFWELWKNKNPNHSHLQKADVYEWVNTMKLIIENDGNKIERMIGVLEYFKKCSAKDARFNPFWFKTIKSLTAFRKVDSNGVKRLDSISSDVVDAGEKYEDFDKLILSTIKKFQENESIKTSGK